MAIRSENNSVIIQELDILAKPESLKIIELFVKIVCERAEKKMMLTGKLEGAHFAAMKQLSDDLKSWSK
jgi:hypothetical protein